MIALPNWCNANKSNRFQSFSGVSINTFQQLFVYLVCKNYNFSKRNNGRTSYPKICKNFEGRIDSWIQEKMPECLMARELLVNEDHRNSIVHLDPLSPSISADNYSLSHDPSNASYLHQHKTRTRSSIMSSLLDTTIWQLYNYTIGYN